MAAARTRCLVSIAACVLAAHAVGCGKRSPVAPTVVNTSLLDMAFAQARQEPNLTSLVVARNGIIERQEYFHGGGLDTTQYVWSVTKSVLSLTVGAAIDRGCLRSLDQTLGELLGHTLVSDPQKAAITLRHLLTMTSGLDFPEMASYVSGPSVYNAWFTALDQVAWVLARTLTATPGQRFEYGSGTIHLASVALTRACGASTATMAEANLFAPLGIPHRPWETDHQGYNNGGAGLELSPRDMQAIGDLVLNNGQYQGRQVVSASWVRAMTSTQVATGAGMPTPAYGYAWWIGQTSGAQFALAHGWGGQFIMVVPGKRLVVTAAATTDSLAGTAAMAQWQRIFDIITQRIVAAY